MARTTRSTKASASAVADYTTSKTPSKVHSLPPAANSQRIFVLPKEATPNARIITLPNPRSGKPTRYYACPTTGLYEFTQVSSDEPRSWLIESPATSVPAGEATKIAHAGELTTISDADLFIATAIDPVFHLISALYKETSSDEKPRYLSADDQLDKIPSDGSHLWSILKWKGMRKIFEDRLSAICTTVDLGGETMYCLNEAKLYDLVLSKASRLAENGLPDSLEDKFVTKVLEPPMVFQAAIPGAVLGDTNEPSSDSTTPSTDTAKPRSFADSAPTPAMPATDVDGFAGGSFVAVKIPEDVLALQRISIAFKFICSKYVSESLDVSLKMHLTKKMDFGPLDTYLAKLAKTRSEAVASRSSDMSRKHPLEDAEDLLQEKKRKVEEEAKKKKLVSRGVKNLQKANTTGMKKLSHFFKKA
ncbi:Ydr279p protein family protein (RNase H2 complexcomponent) [Ceratocystis lukuohia]|uniref:Ribonuclease H2 subunit B n=1 Tax=Ceratocystis lukuohia TaxID=2019550 RepID=A0ABR4MJA4_9PEZI